MHTAIYVDFKINYASMCEKHSITNKFLNPLRAETELSRSNWVNITVDDALAPCVARTSAIMILTM